MNPNAARWTATIAQEANVGADDGDDDDYVDDDDGDADGDGDDDHDGGDDDHDDDYSAEGYTVARHFTTTLPVD